VSEEYVMSKQRGGSGPMDHKLMQSRLGPQLKIFFGRQASRRSGYVWSCRSQHKS
jgi:hypothetical protein